MLDMGGGGGGKDIDPWGNGLRIFDMPILT